jgi:hypothetical protein
MPARCDGRNPGLGSLCEPSAATACRLPIEIAAAAESTDLPICARASRRGSDGMKARRLASMSLVSRCKAQAKPSNGTEKVMALGDSENYYCRPGWLINHDSLRALGRELPRNGNTPPGQPRRLPNRITTRRRCKTLPLAQLRMVRYCSACVLGVFRTQSDLIRSPVILCIGV